MNIQIPKEIGKKNKAEKLRLPAMKTYYKVVINRLCDVDAKKIQKTQWDRIKSLETTQRLVI